MSKNKLYNLHISDNYNEFLLDDIIRRNIVILENFGEDGFIYRRRWEGELCNHTKIKTPVSGGRRNFFNPDLHDEVEKDSDITIIHRCEECFGTGYVGGFHFKEKIRFRYGDQPNRKILFQEQGLQLEEDFNSWTLAPPFQKKLRERDIVVRSDGRIYRVSNPRYSYWRGKELHQRMMLLLIEPNDIVYKVSDENIQGVLDSIDKDNDWDFRERYRENNKAFIKRKR